MGGWGRGGTILKKIKVNDKKNLKFFALINANLKGTKKHFKFFLIFCFCKNQQNIKYEFGVTSLMNDSLPDNSLIVAEEVDCFSVSPFWSPEVQFQNNVLIIVAIK